MRELEHVVQFRGYRMEW